MQHAVDRRRFLAAGAAGAALAATGARAQDGKPPLKIIVPLPAGGVADVSVRIFAEHWTSVTKQSVVVDNRPGGTFLIGVQQLLQSPPDGNTWLHMNNGMSAAQAAFKRFDLQKQIASLGRGGSTPGAIFVNPNAPYRSVKELFDWARANPGKLNYGAPIGAIEHLLAALMLKRNGITGTVVPFKGGPDGMTALAQNEIQMAVSALPLIVPFKGKIMPIAVLTEARSPMVPDVPTFREVGLDIPELDYWGAFGVPAGTPAATIETLNRTIVEVMKMPTLGAKYAQQGMIAKPSSPGEMQRIISDELKWMTPLADELNLKEG